MKTYISPRSLTIALQIDAVCYKISDEEVDEGWARKKNNDYDKKKSGVGGKLWDDLK